MAGAVQRNARFAIVVYVNGRHSAGVADRRRRIVDILSVLSVVLLLRPREQLPSTVMNLSVCLSVCP